MNEHIIEKSEFKITKQIKIIKYHLYWNALMGKHQIYILTNQFLILLDLKYKVFYLPPLLKRKRIWDLDDLTINSDFQIEEASFEDHILGVITNGLI